MQAKYTWAQCRHAVYLFVFIHVLTFVCMQTMSEHLHGPRWHQQEIIPKNTNGKTHTNTHTGKIHVCMHADAPLVYIACECDILRVPVHADSVAASREHHPSVGIDGLLFAGYRPTKGWHNPFVCGFARIAPCKYDVWSQAVGMHIIHARDHFASQRAGAS